MTGRRTGWRAGGFGRIPLHICLLLLIGLGGCRAAALPDAPPVAIGGSGTVEPALATALPTLSPLPTAAPTGTPTATATVAPPTLTPSPEPSPTATPTLTPTATAVPETAVVSKLIGFSADGNAIEGWQVGSGPEHVVFVGGIHGGYEWNTILLAYEVLDYLLGNPHLVPPAVTLTIIPVANPDGQARIVGRFGRFAAWEVSGETGPGRFNGNGVDLNRNWDCDWQPYSEWGPRTVSGGSGPFSEPEVFYLNDFILKRNPRLVVFWHSKFPGIFPGFCDGAPLADTVFYGQLYATASGYPYVAEGFTDYAITGDASDYLSRIGIPSFAVETEAYNDPETDRNLAGVLAILATFR